MSNSRIAFAGLFLLINVAGASAQSPAATARARLAESEVMGVTGSMVSLSAPVPMLPTAPLAVAIGSREVEAPQIRNTAAFRDGARQVQSARGARIGAAVGSMLGATLAIAGCQRSSSCAGAFYIGAAAGVLPGAGIGALVGHRITRRSVAYDSGAKAGGQ